MPHSASLSTSSQTKMSRPSSGSTSSANVFPRQAGATLLSPDRYIEQHSPSPSQFSFASSPPLVREEDDNLSEMRPITRGTTGHSRPATSRSRQQFFEDSFAYKEGTTSSARDRVTKDAPIIAELRTNVIVQDEYTLVTDLSHHLSTRYQRPETSIMITVNHSACLLLGGSFEPTYVLTINALPVQLMPTLNKRNAALIQTFMAESIGVMPDRGIIKFLPIPEESLAMNGMTVLGEIERLERQNAEENGSNIKRAMTKSSRKSAMSKAKSSMQLSRNSSKATTDTRSVITPPLSTDGPLDSGVAINEKGISDITATEAVDRPVSSKRSELHLSKFSKKSDADTNLAGLHVPHDHSGPRTLSKHKSFLNVFRR